MIHCVLFGELNVNLCLIGLIRIIVYIERASKWSQNYPQEKETIEGLSVHIENKKNNSSKKVCQNNKKERSRQQNEKLEIHQRKYDS